MSRGAPRRPRHARSRRAAPVAALLLAFAAVAGCGQRGPLMLPDSARPIERLDPAQQRPQPSAEGARSGASPGGAAPAQPGAVDDEADDEAGDEADDADEAAENER